VAHPGARFAIEIPVSYLSTVSFRPSTANPDQRQDQPHPHKKVYDGVLGNRVEETKMGLT
jgi:hypothetical protein